jgi:hypothetical protein
MSNPYEASNPSLAGEPVLPAQRPASATVFGVLNLVFGIFGICGGVVTGGLLVVLAIPEMAESLNELEGMEAFQNPSYRAFLLVTTIINSLLTIVLLISGAGLLKFKAWGRTAAIWYAIPQIVAIIAGGLVQFFLFIKPAIENAAPGAQGIGEISGAIGGIVGMFFSLLYPVLLLIFMNRKTFVAHITAQ